MPENIPSHIKLLVVSDTGMFQKNGNTYAFGPVVKELGELNFFNNIIWIGFNKKQLAGNKSFLEITDERIHTIGLQNTGGKTVVSKFFIILNYPVYFLRIFREIFKSKYIHVRAPSNPAVAAMIVSYFFPKKQFWFKYAGDWQGNAPFFYNIQRKWLKNLGKNSKVTVNGAWINQPKNILSFENPCLDSLDRLKGKSFIDSKNIKDKIDYCFVGGLNENKGCMLLLEALKNMNLPANFGSLHIVGDGHLKQELELLAKKLSIEVLFYGSLPKQKVVSIYEKCHFLVLPSKSEGFPKVLGEAMNFGCIPIVSNISCINQYVQDEKNGILINAISISGIVNSINKSFEVTEDDFTNITKYNYKIAKRFTYQNYNNRVFSEIYS
ncbi:MULTISPECIES: glycosyltransferase [Aequorivita]|uniref:Glycosyltransferase family 4 protein n=1 Tax=Aequorivita iocasae TaxID=2803865 RepID=A0ABX7DRZ4_9FLAO|nr:MULTISPECIES: glycosyltransferase [Aequorivita]QQX76773.1 glycosyltransferase family 4 protein [Aequorivita iocasae]UCA56245.1 glycosyltransferase [Aequorivita sp. F7]